VTIHDHLDFVGGLAAFFLFVEPANRCSLTLLYDLACTDLNFPVASLNIQPLSEHCLATDCMALDVRIFRILERVGLKVSPADIFEQLERELVRKVAKPLGLSGAQLDRILFGQYSKIVKADSLT
jgi:hypothetical protein